MTTSLRAAMEDDTRQRAESLNLFESIAVSLGFWLTLIAATSMYAGLVLAPKIIENIDLQIAASQLEEVKNRRHQEVAHLIRLANAIEHDAEFLARIRSREFALKREGTVEIAVPAELGFDARVPQFEGQQAASVTSWYEGFLRNLSSPTEFKRNWCVVMLCLFLVSFLVMNERFFSNQWGKATLHSVGNVFQRYRVPSANLDEEGCQRSA